MPASAFDETAAVVVHALDDTIDDEIGIRFRMDGLLLKSLTYNPARDDKAKKGHMDFEEVWIQTNLRFMLDVDADITHLTGTFSAKHPGQPFNRTVIENYFTDIAHGFPQSGYFRTLEPVTTAPQGDLLGYKFRLHLIAAPDEEVNLVLAP